MTTSSPKLATPANTASVRKMASHHVCAETEEVVMEGTRLAL